MKRIIAFFTSNWGLKILALILALVAYCSMKESSHDGRGTNNPADNNASPTFILKGTGNGGK